MIDDRIHCIIFNAFNGLGDSTGDDSFGVSVAWVDLDDHLEPEGLDHEAYPFSDDVSAYVKSHPEVDGARWVLAYLTADGNRYIYGFPSKAEMMATYREYERDYLEWLDQLAGRGAAPW